MLSQKSNVAVIPKLTAEERFKIILSRPRKANARIRLAMTKTNPEKQEADK